MWLCVVLNTPGKREGLSHRRSRGHPNHAQNYTAHRWTKPLRLYSRIIALARETLWSDYQTLNDDRFAALWAKQSQPHAAQWPGLSQAEFPWSKPKSRSGFSSSYHLLEVVTPVAELLDHESLKSCFCTWENWMLELFAWVAEPPHTAHLITALFAFQWVNTLLPPCTPSPVCALSSSDPQHSEFQASIQCSNSDLATNKCFSLLLEFKENY